LKIDIDFTNEYPEKRIQRVEGFPEEDYMLILSRKDIDYRKAIEEQDNEPTSFKEWLHFLFIIVICPGLVFLLIVASLCLWLGDIQENRQYKKQLEEKNK